MVSNDAIPRDHGVLARKAVSSYTVLVFTVVRQSFLFAILMVSLMVGCREPIEDPIPTSEPAPLTDDVIFDPATVHHFYVELDEADWDWLNADPRAEIYVPATMIFNGQRYEEASIRYKGAYGSLYGCFDDLGNQTCDKLGIKISFNEIDPAGRFAGLRKLIFQSNERDPSLLHERLSYHLFREAGVPAGRATHAQLTVNGEYQGLFGLVEYIDKEFLEERWQNPEGNLYKEVWPQFLWPGIYRNALRTNDETGDVTDMVEFYIALQSATPVSFVSDTERWVDLEAWARYMVVDQITDNWDGIARFYCHIPSNSCNNHNFYLYDNPMGTIDPIPWDLDHTFTSVNDDLTRSWWIDQPNNCLPISMCDIWGIPNCPQQFQDMGILPPQCDFLTQQIHHHSFARYVEVMDIYRDIIFQQENLTALLESWRVQLEDIVANDIRGPGLNAWNQANNELDWILTQQMIEVDVFLAEQGF